MYYIMTRAFFSVTKLSIYTVHFGINFQTKRSEIGIFLADLAFLTQPRNT